MSPVPRALSRARLWTSGVLTASTLLVGGIGVHLAQDHAASVATTSSTTTTSGTASDSSAASGSSTSSSSTDTGIDTGTDTSSSGTSNQSSGFQAVAPLSGSGGQAQSGSGGS